MLNLFNYTDNNFKKIIDQVLSYYKEKNKNNSIVKENKSFQIELNKNLSFKV
jgi:hypothetical protein